MSRARERGQAGGRGERRHGADAVRVGVGTHLRLVPGGVRPGRERPERSDVLVPGLPQPGLGRQQLCVPQGMPRGVPQVEHGEGEREVRPSASATTRRRRARILRSSDGPNAPQLAKAAALESLTERVSVCFPSLPRLDSLSPPGNARSGFGVLAGGRGLRRTRRAPAPSTSRIPSRSERGRRKRRSRRDRRSL